MCIAAWTNEKNMWMLGFSLWEEGDRYIWMEGKCRRILRCWIWISVSSWFKTDKIIFPSSTFLKSLEAITPHWAQLRCISENNQKSSAKWLTPGLGQRRYKESLEYSVAPEARKTNESMSKGPRSHSEGTPTSHIWDSLSIEKNNDSNGF